jgi:hypothetical protein
MRQGKSWIMDRYSNQRPLVAGWLLAAVLLVGQGQQTSWADSPTVAAVAAINHVGRTATVCGVVASAKFATSTSHIRTKCSRQWSGAATGQTSRTRRNRSKAARFASPGRSGSTKAEPRSSCRVPGRFRFANN